MAPAQKIKENRGVGKFIFLSIITAGIYGLVCMCNVSTDINTIASRYDGKKTPNFILMVLIFLPITLGIAEFTWHHRFCNRIGDELRRRGLDYSFSARDFWLWYVLGSLIVVGPIIFGARMFKAMNALAADYNKVG